MHEQMYICTFCSFIFKGVLLMDMLLSTVLKLFGNTMDVNFMDVRASKIQPINRYSNNKNGLKEKQNWRSMVARLLKCHVVNGEKC